MNARDIQKLLDEESDGFEYIFDKEKVNEKINKLLIKEKRADTFEYKNVDSKRRIKLR